MLRLSRNVGESIWIGDDIEIRIMLAGTKRVEVGITAPPEIKILRGELRQATGGTDSVPNECQ